MPLFLLVISLFLSTVTPRQGWDQRVGDQLALLVSIQNQTLYGIQEGKILFEYSCSTAAKGIGNTQGSYQTPLGWHKIDEKIGDRVPLRGIFKKRVFTGDIWDGTLQSEDLVLTRILLLRGLETGINIGPGIDTYNRCIYIHGTNEESKLGTPASHGCIRLSNWDVRALYTRIPKGTLVLIIN